MASEPPSSRGSSPAHSTPVGRYRDLTEVGRGGMGIVYRAWDPELGREVALKRPQADLASTPEGRRRFLREARATARLSHPHIVRIHDVFEHDGIPWLAMEFIRGESLQRRLAAGAWFEPPDLLRHGEALASALAAAHGEGILHRDIKPHNILLASDGRALLTDFGLARFFVDPGRESGAPTGSGGSTDDGRILGTHGYMSPEQALGRSVDARSDIYSLGVVLCEMWLGLGACAGEEAAVTVDDLLRRSSEDGSRPRDAIAVPLAGILARALALHPQDRYQHAAELGSELGSLRRSRDGGIAASASVTASTVGADGSLTARRRRRLMLAAGLALGAIAVAAGLILASRRNGGREATLEMEALVTWPGVQLNGRVSPDGRWISFISGRDGPLRLWLRSAAGGEARVLDLPEGEIVSHVWSDDSQRVAYLSLRSSGVQLQVAPAFGGPPEQTLALPREFMDGRLLLWRGSEVIVTVPSRGLRRIDLGQGTIQEVLPAESEEGFRGGMEVSTDGRWLAYILALERESGLRIRDLQSGRVAAPIRDAFQCEAPHWLGSADDALICSSTEGGQVDLWRVSLPTGERTRITFSSEVEQVEDTAADGSFVLFRRVETGAHLWRLDPRSGEMAQLTADALHDNCPSSGEAAPLVAFQREKTRVTFPAAEGNSQILLGRLGPRGLETARVVVADGTGAHLSPEGRWIAFVRAPPGPTQELWLGEIRTGGLRRISESFAAPRRHMVPLDRIDLNLTWGPDRALYFVAHAGDGGDEIRRLRSEVATAEPERLLSGGPGIALSDLSVSSDASRLAYVRSSGRFRTASEVRVLELGSGEEHPLLAYDHAIGELLVCRGWTASGRSLVVLRTTAGSFWDQGVEVLELDLAGEARSVARLDRAFAGTARLDRERGTVYLTGVARGGSAHGVFAVSLADGSVREVTRNGVAGISFAGIEPLPDGQLLLARQDRNDSLWSIRFHR
jgi:Tol biopolymer transport system component/predicted Ser/Thr protein kinase